MRKPNFTLIAGAIPFVFVVPPTDFSMDSSQSHESIQILDKGEITLDGNRQCRRISFSGFFPNRNSNFYSFMNPLPPIACAEFLQHHKDVNTKLKFIIPEWTHFLKCKIESFTVSHNDHTGDMYYTISLVEEREDISNTLDLATGLYRRVMSR